MNWTLLKERAEQKLSDTAGKGSFLPDWLGYLAKLNTDKSFAKEENKKILNSIRFEIFHLPENIVDVKDVTKDEVKILSKEETDFIYGQNALFYERIASEISIKSDYVLGYVLPKFKVATEQKDFQDKRLSDTPILNFLLKSKLFFINELFSFLIEFVEKVNSAGVKERSAVIKYLVHHYHRSLKPKKQLDCFQSFITWKWGFNVCKETSDNYARELINLLEDKLQYFEDNRISKLKDKKGKAVQETVVVEFDKKDRGVSLEEVERIVNECLSKVVEQLKPEEKEEEELLSRKEVANLFGISYDTLHRWCNDENLLKPLCHKMGRRVYFYKSEVLEKLKTVRRYGRGK